MGMLACEPACEPGCKSAVVFVALLLAVLLDGLLTELLTRDAIGIAISTAQVSEVWWVAMNHSGFQ
jgi:hypothetical protein